VSCWCDTLLGYGLAFVAGGAALAAMLVLIHKIGQWRG